LFSVSHSRRGSRTGPLAPGSVARMSRVDMARWVLTGFTLALLVYATCTALLAPTLKQGFAAAGDRFLDQRSHWRDASGSFSLAALDDTAGAVVLADRAYAEDTSAVMARAADDPHLTHRAPVSGAQCTSCTFLFPRPPPGSPTSSFFVTAIPNRGAGVGHQFGEWLTGPFLAVSLNMTYVATDLLRQSTRWNTFLGLTDGEHTIEDLHGTYGGLGQIVQRSQSDRSQDFEKLPMLDWTRTKMQELAVDPALRLVTDAIDPRALTVAHKALTPGLPLPLFVVAHETFVPLHKVACLPGIHNIIRQKYCAARIRSPVTTDLYAADRAAGRIIVTWHLRCGDSCFSPMRATSFDSIVSTSWEIKKLFERMEPQRELAFFFFSQPPKNTTAEEHFAPLLARLEPLRVSTHWHARSTTVMHHLITSDVLIGAMSGFSWLAFLHHHGLALGAIPSCSDEVTYDRFTGEFDHDKFEQMWHKYKDKVPQYRNWKDCLAMEHSE